MIILGINAYHADSSACLIKDGEIIAAVEEERFTRDKHWAGFPTNHDELKKILERENRIKLYNDCLKFLKTRVDLDLALFKEDIWSH